jgi:hypothetical protein
MQYRVSCKLADWSAEANSLWAVADGLRSESVSQCMRLYTTVCCQYVLQDSKESSGV